ncbi:MAG: class 1 fructose-bisphosphatase [Flavobacteriales bacterium]|tara:strand:+ start:460 stop:1440 length:981 start_codon:yes stop_codon:yes gene_type:complete
MIAVTTLDEFIIDKQDDFPFAGGDLSRLLRDIGFASKIVNREVNKAGLVDIAGAAGSENIQGEQQQKLDVFADEVFIRALKNGGEVCGIASEENDDFIAFENENSRNGKYVVAMDPLDGSSNIDVNVSIGTIFSIFRRKSEIGSLATMNDFLQLGTEQVAGGYVLYGSSSMLVYTTGAGVNGFTLDPSIGEFCLSHADMKTAENGKIYSMNEGNYYQSHAGIQKYLDKCKKEQKTGRYIGSLVADFHRNLIKGGVYLYPDTTSAPNGKLRLLYECNPLAFIVEQAGGKASDGNQRIMEINPTELHQRCPYYAGSKNMVEEIEALLK